ncbi:MAG: PmoA family protein [Niabella sp.]
MKHIPALICFILPVLSLPAQKGFSINMQPDKKQADIFYNNQLLTSYCYYDSVAKPVLFPVNTIDGITVTRGYPIDPKKGERTDHPHHIGIWLNYESVNGIDFWNNSPAIPAEKKELYGTIKHDKILETGSSGKTAFLSATAGWYNNKGSLFLKESNLYHFKIANDVFIIDRTTTLTAANEPVVFKDVKDGFFAIRVARELEMPSKEPAVFIDAHGNKTKVDPFGGNTITGMYYNSNDIKGDSVWSSKAPWTMLKGKKDGKDITIAIFDHPTNTGYPAYWHARGYGLFAINPLGRKIFSNGTEELNYTLQPLQSVTFRYRITIASKDLDKHSIENLAKEFSEKR